MKKWFKGSEFLEIINSIKNRNFKGNKGLAIKNSFYQFSTNFVAKIGGLFFTIILARLLMPELFGLYSLAIATIFIFISFTDLGIGSAIITFVSRYLSRGRKGKAKGHLV